MSHDPIRKDKTCLNCRHVVEQRFCSNCGQENTESRKTFYQLFLHFFEDLTHYENAFWRTIRNLLFKPASLTKEYLSGKRLSYLAPVRLYIFISFITFLLISLIPETIESREPDYTANSMKIESEKRAAILKNATTLLAVDSLEQKRLDSIKKRKEKFDDLFRFGYRSQKELDSIQKFGSADDRLSGLEYWVVKKGLQVKDKNPDNKELMKKFKESFGHNFPKALFIYMPIFAFFLWLFHGKKRWYYFDHGIFTLHYFSFLLLISLIIFLLNALTDLFDSDLFDSIVSLVSLAGMLWMIYYFYPAHHRFYGESRWMSFLKSSVLFFINIILISIILTVFAIYTFINLH